MILLTTTQAADFLGISKRTLDGMRLSGRGPVYVKVGSLVRYPSTDLDEWLLSNQRRSTSDQNLEGGRPSCQTS
jgi:excisionase family DNA binding protein